MKAPTKISNLIGILSAILLLGSITCQAQQIDARALTPQEIHDNELPEGTQSSGGLLTTGIDEAVYLEVQVPSGTTVNGVVWSVATAPAGSTATLEESPIPMEMPIYSPGDRNIYDLAARKMFTPDVVGQYLITAVVDIGPDGPLELEAIVTGAEYVGSGIVDGASPVYPQCALCHPQNAMDYAETGHATFFQEALDGIKSSHYGEDCMGCHVLGLNPSAKNGNFYDIADQVGWTFPEELVEGQWDAMPDELKAVSNIQCEHCHGAGSEHHGIKSAISVSLNAGDCGQCHDEEPYHAKSKQWNLSGHASVIPEESGSCVRCHSGIGFVQTLDGKDEISTEYEAITCAACHDPHSTENEAQIRKVSNITLMNGVEVTAGGTGKLCMNCHMSRRVVDEYVQEYHSHYGPHHGPQGDLLAGTGGVEYGKDIGSSNHIYAVENSCVDCHMQAVSGDNPAKDMAGEHTFKITWDNDTPDIASDDVDMVGACVECHGPMDSFDIPRADFNYDGAVEGVQTEVEHLMAALGKKLPPLGDESVEVSDTYTPAELKAAYNYMMVLEDGSHGIHNTKYTVGILQAALNDVGDPYNAILGGTNVPMGGEWFYSWFEFYAPGDDGWIYHFEHGHITVVGDANNVYFYEDNTGLWRYTNKELYPSIYDFASGQWMYYAGRWKEQRHFYLYNSGEWVITD